IGERAAACDGKHRIEQRTRVPDARVGDALQRLGSCYASGEWRTERLVGGAHGRCNEQRPDNDGGTQYYAEHSPSITSGANAWLSPRSMKSSSLTSFGRSCARSFSASVATAAGMRRKKAPRFSS